MGNGCKKPESPKETRYVRSATNETDYFNAEEEEEESPIELMEQARKLIKSRREEQECCIANRSPKQKCLSVHKDRNDIHQNELNVNIKTATQQPFLVLTNEQCIQADQYDIIMNSCHYEQLQIPSTTIYDGKESNIQSQRKCSYQQQPVFNMVEPDRKLEDLSSNTSSLVNLWINSNSECATGMPPIILQKYVSRFGPNDEKKVSSSSMRSSFDSGEIINRPSTDAIVQTDDSSFAYNEHLQFVARPPTYTKSQVLQNEGCNFSKIDQLISETPKDAAITLRTIVQLVNSHANNDFLRVRAFFKWITRNISYNWRVADCRMTADQVLRSRMGVSKDYCTLFAELCRLSGIRCQILHGFVKDGSFRPGYEFQCGQNSTHTWNVVLLNASWRFIDCTLGSGYMDSNGKFMRRLYDHFFLTDPSQFIWTHFPYDKIDRNYSSRWQLLDHPISLQEFNSRPKVTAKFFELELKIRQNLLCPITFEYRAEVAIDSPQIMRYLFKLYSNEQPLEDQTLKRHVFCTLHEKRLLATFRFTPPVEGHFILKIYAHPESTIRPDTVFHDVAAFSLICTRCVLGTPMLPMNDLPWGPTQLFYDLGLKLVNNDGAILRTISGRKTLVLEKSQPLTVSYRLTNAQGVTLDPKQGLAFEEKGSILRFIIRPNMDGFFKFAVFAILNKKKQKGTVIVPCVATFLIDCPVCYLSANEIRLAAIPPPKNKKGVCSKKGPNKPNTTARKPPPPHPLRRQPTKKK